MIRASRKRAAFFVAALITTFPFCEAAAQDVQACVAAAGRGQDLRSNGHLSAAREAFLVCASARCPQVVRSDCTRWVADTEANTPTVVLAATAGGRDITDVRASLDGAPMASSLDGKATRVDPGPHTLRLEHAGQVREERVVLAEGEKNRKITVEFVAVAPGAPPPATVTTAATPPERNAPSPPSAARLPTPDAAPKPPVLAYVLGGVGVAALGGFGYFGLAGKADYRELQRTCNAACSDAQIGKVRNELVVADVSLVVAVISLGVATWLLVAPPR